MIMNLFRQGTTCEKCFINNTVYVWVVLYGVFQSFESLAKRKPLKLQDEFVLNLLYFIYSWYLFQLSPD